MSRTGNCWDNAVAESFFHTFKTELIYLEDFATHEQAQTAVFEDIEVFYSGFTILSSMPCSDLGCWGSYEDTLPSTPRSKHRARVPGCGGSA